MSNYPSDLPAAIVTAPGPEADRRAYTPDEYLAAQALFTVRYMLHRMSYYTRPHGDNTYVYDPRGSVLEYAESMASYAQCFASVAVGTNVPASPSNTAMDAAIRTPRLAYQWAFHADLIARVAEQVVRIEAGEASPRSLLGDLPLGYFGLTKFWWKQSIIAACILFDEREHGLQARRAWFERNTTEIVRPDGSCDLSEELPAKGASPSYPTLHTSTSVDDFD